MTADERLIDLDAANERLASMNLNGDQHNEHLFLPTAIIDGAITGGTAMGGGVDLRGWTQKAEPPIPPAEPTRKRAEAVRGKCQRCGDAYSRHKLGLTGDVRYCRRGTAGSTWSAPAPAVAASTKQEGGAGITEEQAERLKYLIVAKDHRRIEYEVAQANADELRGLYADTSAEVERFIDSLRAKDARW